MNFPLFLPGFPRSTARRPCAFSLVEVTLALGIMSFALVGLLGLLPVGLSTFRSTMDSSTGTQIAQRLLNEAQQTDFNQLTLTPQTLRYFDDQGNELTVANKAKALYDTNLVVVSATKLPGAAVSNQNLAAVLLQIANNPNNLQLTSGSNYQWTAVTGLTISSYATNVARNQ